MPPTSANVSPNFVIINIEQTMINKEASVYSLVFNVPGSEPAL